MIIFEKITKQLCCLGILKWNSSSKSKYLSIYLSSFSLLMILIYFMSSIYFLLYKTQSPLQYVESIVCTLFSMNALSWILIYLWNANKYAGFIDELNEIIRKSKKKINFSSLCEVNY